MTHDEHIRLAERIRVYEELALEFHVDMRTNPDFPQSAVGLCAQFEAMFVNRAHALLHKVNP